MAVKTSSTVHKAFTVLELIADMPRPAHVSELSTKTGYDRATVYRLLMTLSEAGYIIHNPDTKRFELGYKVVTLARSKLQEDQEIDSIRDVMRQISLKSTEACHYSVLENDECVIALRERGKQLVMVDFAVGSRSDLYCTAGGKAILAFQDTMTIQRYLGGTFKKLTDTTITSRDALGRELKSIRTNGVAYDNEELMPGLRCLAAPVFEADGSVSAAIAMSGPCNRYTDTRIAELEKVLREGAREMSRRRGGTCWVV